jgi:glucose/arabinose dehydrogenase
MAGDNGPDADYPEELNVIREGAHYGFPWRLSDSDNPQRRPDYDPASDKLLQPGFWAVQRGFYHNDPTFPSPPTGVTFVDPIRNVGPDADLFRDPSTGAERNASQLGTSTGTFTPHRVPIGLAFDRGALCGDFSGGLFVLSFGADTATTLSDTGHDLSLIKFVGANEVQSFQLVRGLGTPVDEVLVGNRLYVLQFDLVASSIWEITLPRKP